MRSMILLAVLATLGLASSTQAQEAPAGPRPAVEFIVAPGEASTVPYKQAVAWANGGVIDVAQPNPTTLVVTMSGLTATNADLVRTSAANYQFELTQGVAVAVNSPRVKSAKLSLEGRVIGLLRTNHEPYTHVFCTTHCGVAETQPATATVSCEGGGLLTLTLPGRSAAGCDDLSVYNHEGPLCARVTCGHYTLHETWGFGTTHPPFFCRGASAEFAPNPTGVQGPGSYWFEHFQPFNGSATKDFGYQVTLKLTPEFKTADDKAGGETEKEDGDVTPPVKNGDGSREKTGPKEKP